MPGIEPCSELAGWLHGLLPAIYLGGHSIWLAIRPGRAVVRFAGPSCRASYPPFVAPGSSTFASMLELGLVFVTMALVWLNAYAAVIARDGHMLGRPRIRRAFDVAMGTVLVAFGTRLAVEQG